MSKLETTFQPLSREEKEKIRQLIKTDNSPVKRPEVTVYKPAANPLVSPPATPGKNQ